jgi:hypothetical protein
MFAKIAVATFVSLSLLSLALSSELTASAAGQYSRLTSQELEIIKRINGTDVYGYDLELEKIALNHTISEYAFRSAGSVGANETAKWIEEQFESFGLETQMESFNFTNWNLLNQPTLVVDDGGNSSTTYNQTIINSFQSAQYSWPTPNGGVFAPVVVLPLPNASSLADFERTPVGNFAYNRAHIWDDINTTGRIVLIGEEIQWDSILNSAFGLKLMMQPPAAVICTWWYDWMSFAPPTFSPLGGRGVGGSGHEYWDLKIPVGWVSYSDGLWIRNREKSMNVSARVTIPAVIGSGSQYNVVGKLKGSTDPEKTIIISAHYETVMDAGFCEDGAGTAGLIELARVFAEAAKQGSYAPEETLVFIAFAGKDIGMVGSVNYVKQHIAELKSVTAVINLDSIGSDVLEVADTASTKGLDLSEIALNAASDLGVQAQLMEPSGSDQEAFRDPVGTNEYYESTWGVNSGISNATPVVASTELSSYPLLPSDVWQGGKPGWADTPYDNSTSTGAFNWVNASQLEGHTQVAALSVMRILSYIYSPFLQQVASVAIIVIVIGAVAVYFERSRARVFLRELEKRGGDTVYFLGFRGFVYIFVLTAFFLFASATISMRVGRIKLALDNNPAWITTFDFGFPLKMGVILNPETAAETTFVNLWSIGRGNPRVLIFWYGAIADIIVYFLLASVLVYLILRFLYEREFARA